MKKFIAVCTLFSAVVCIRADAVADFQKADRLYQQRKYSEAAGLFGEIAKTEQGASRDKALLFQSLALGNDRKTEDALKTADAVSNAAMKAYARMNALFQTNKWNELVQEFKAEKIEDWSEDFAYQGRYMRGVSLCYVRETAAGLAELEKALADCGSDEMTKMILLMHIANFSRSAGNQERALAAAGQALETKDFRGHYTFFTCAFTKTGILIEQKKFDEAGKVLDDLNKGRTWGAKNLYFCLWLTAYGDLELARGNTEKAKEFYQKAADSGVQEYFVNAAKKKLENLSK